MTGVHPLANAPPPFPLVETFLVVNPTDPDNLLASAMSVSAERSLVYGSWDGGSTWKLVEGPDAPAFPGGDPMLAFDAAGRAYLSTITPEISVWRSADQGHTWAGPVVVTPGRAADRQWVATPQQPTTETLPVYVAAKTARGGRESIVWSVSRDRGETFAEPILMPVDSGYLHTVSDLVVTRKGRVVMSYLVNYARVSADPEVYRGRRWIRISGDGGETWAGPHLVTGNLQYGNATWDQAMKGLGGGDLAVDESSGSFDGTAYLTWPAVVDHRIQIVMARSADGGRSWSEPIRVNDGGFDSDHSTPTVAVNRRGVVAVTWNDRRHRPDDLCFHHYIAVSEDGGRTFGPNRRISQEETCPGARSRWLNGGDTQGLAGVSDDGFRVVWTGGGSPDALRPWTAVVRTR